MKMSNFVTIESEVNKKRLKNLFYVWVFIWFAWILFHFTIVYFFWLFLKSILLIGIFLWIGNFVALILDIPIWTLQKYIKPKTFLSIWVVMMILVSLIFVKFVYLYSMEDITWVNAWQEWFMSMLAIFLNSSLNIILLLISAMMYGVIKESFDVTIISYIFNNSTPSQYANVLSKYNIFNGWGAMMGLIFSWILLAINIKIAIPIFTFILIWFLVFVFRYFDNNDETLEFEKIKTIKLDVLKNDLLQKWDAMISSINTKTFIELSRQSKVILLKPIEIKKSINFWELITSTKIGFETFYKIILWTPRNIIILWFLALIMQYGFWDTFVATFLIEFFEKLLWENADIVNQTKGILSWYILLWLLVIPAFWFQQFFINLSKKIWVFKVIMFGNLISAISLVCFGLLDNFFLVMWCGILNSVGYAATMPLAQATFSGIYNVEYAKKFNLKEIDTTISAAPLKILINSTNVVGLLLWSVLVRILGFNLFFVVFWTLIWTTFIVSVSKFKTVLSKFSEKNKSWDTDVDFV